MRGAGGGNGVWRIRGGFEDLELRLDPPRGAPDGTTAARTCQQVRWMMANLAFPEARASLVAIHACLLGGSAQDLNDLAGELERRPWLADRVCRDLEAAAEMGRLVARPVPLERGAAKAGTGLPKKAPFVPLPPVHEPETSWIGLALVDQNGAPLPGRAYRVVAADRRLYEGTLGDDGTAVVRGLENGLCKVACPAVTPHPSLIYTVQEGDHLSGIAQQYGFDDYTVVWNHPQNASLRSLRDDPHVLAPGDQVFIPELKEAPVGRKTGDEYTFDLSVSPLKVRLQLLDLLGKPVAGAAMTAADRPLTTDGNGLVGFTVSKTTQDVDLDAPPGDAALDVADLDPPDDTSTGCKARLFNLGFLWDPTVDDDDDEMVVALQDFQAHVGLPVTGQLDDATKTQLVQVHGC